MVIHASRCCAMKHEIKKVCVCVCVCVLMDMCLHFESRSFINRRRRHLGLSYRAILRAKYQLQYRSAILTPEGHLPVSWAISTLNALTHLLVTALLSSKANNSILTSQHQRKCPWGSGHEFDLVPRRAQFELPAPYQLGALWLPPFYILNFHNSKRRGWEYHLISFVTPEPLY